MKTRIKHPLNQEGNGNMERLKQKKIKKRRYSVCCMVVVVSGNQTLIKRGPGNNLNSIGLNIFLYQAISENFPSCSDHAREVLEVVSTKEPFLFSHLR